VDSAYAYALDPTDTTFNARSDPQQTISLGLSQTFDAKLKPPPGDTTSEPRKIKLRSRWGKNAQRYSSERTVETANWVKEPDGGRRLNRKAVTEILFVQRGHEPYSWKNGAKVRKV